MSDTVSSLPVEQPIHRPFRRPTRHDWNMALTITRREVRDALRDWRIVIPIILLTLGFPLLMSLAARELMAFVTEYNSEAIGDRLIPLLLMIVGFFPTSFSLVIALETFVGEKERRSLEPLLATPLTNTQLYLGKTLAALAPPLLASYMGIAVYAVGIVLTIGWSVPFSIFALVVALTTVQAVIMVSGAVVVSSQTTSVRAANLLASFIIVPMALLIQFEAAMMFWGNRQGLWVLALGLVIVAGVLLRIGVQLFNREELLGGGADRLRLSWALGQVWNQFTGRSTNDGHYPRPLRWYRESLGLLGGLRDPALIGVLTILIGLLVGIALGQRFPLPAGLSDTIGRPRSAEDLEAVQLIASQLPLVIFYQNVRALLIGALLGLFSLGVGGLAVTMLPWAIIGYLGYQLGAGSLGFLLTAVLPHGIVEIPAVLIAAAAALRWHAVFLSAPQGLTLSERWLRAGTDFARLFVAVVIPLLLIAAILEAYVTPALLLQLFGRT